MRWAIAFVVGMLLVAAPAMAAGDEATDITAVVTVDHSWARSAGISGVEIVATDGGDLVVSGSPEAIGALSTSDHVTSIRQVWAPQELVVSEGAALVGGDIWGQSSHPRQRVRVAIVDTGFAGLTALLGTELPATVTTRSYRLDGLVETGSGHGVAVAEIVHDVAPGAEIFLVAVDSDIRMGAVVDYLIANDVDVVSMSIGWTRGPYDGSAPVTQHVERAVAAGITWVNAAGNEARTHWTGPFVDADSDGRLEFSGSDEVNRFSVPPGQRFTIDIGWTGGGDLDVCLYTAQGSVDVFEKCSVLSQGPDDPPAESLLWTNTSAQTVVYGFSVRYYSGTPQRVDAFLGGSAHSLEHNTESSSVVVPAESSAVITVGAVPWFEPSSIAYYSSRGPAISGEIKPDFVSASSVSTSTIPAFSGTSAAAPHVAGVAALILGVDNSLSPGEVKTALSAVAIPVGIPGKSNTYGWGRSHAGFQPGVIVRPVGTPEHDSLGLVDRWSGIWTLYDRDGAARVFYFGNPGDIPMTGDWDCDGVDTPGLYRPADGYVYLRNSNTSGIADISFYFGNPGDRPLAGDFDGDGCDTVSLYRPSEGAVFITDSIGIAGQGLGAAAMGFHFGDPEDTVVVADFDGDGATEVGVRRGSTVYFSSVLGATVADGSFDFGEPDDAFVAADWYGHGDSPGVWRAGERTLYYRSSFGAGPVADALQLRSPASGPASVVPLAGFWG